MSPLKAVAQAIEAYFESMRKEQGYIVDGVDGDELAAIVLAAAVRSGLALVTQEGQSK